MYEICTLPALTHRAPRPNDRPKEESFHFRHGDVQPRRLNATETVGKRREVEEDEIKFENNDITLFRLGNGFFRSPTNGMHARSNAYLYVFLYTKIREEREGAEKKESLTISFPQLPNSFPPYPGPIDTFARVACVNCVDRRRRAIDDRISAKSVENFARKTSISPRFRFRLRLVFPTGRRFFENRCKKRKKGKGKKRAQTDYEGR